MQSAATGQAPHAISEVLAGVQRAIDAIEALPLSAQQFVLNLVNDNRIAELHRKQQLALPPASAE
jgi:hypothetical protein